MQIVVWAFGVFAAACLLARPAWADRAVATTLSIFWIAVAIGYHVLFFSVINQAAYIFGALFALMAMVFLIEGTIRNRLHFTKANGLRGGLAAATITYALLIYPVLGLLVTHPYPQTPMFGVTPCPTTIFTLGMLMLLHYPNPLLVALIPLLWSIVGGSGAFLLDMPQDWGLPAAAVAWVMANTAPLEPYTIGPRRKLARSLIAGTLYFAFVFAVGFFLGIIRVLIVMPRTGELMAVILELPVILASAWVICRWLSIRFLVSAEIRSRMVMGVTAFALLLMAEVALSALFFNNSLNGYLGAFRTVQGLIGLAGQIVFGLFPVLQLMWLRPSD
jgi:hypothetical protein